MTKYRLIDDIEEDSEHQSGVVEAFDVAEAAGLASRQASGESVVESDLALQHRLTTINVASVREDAWFEVVHNVSSVSGFYKLSLAAIAGLLNPNLSLLAEEFQFTARERDIKLAAYLTLAFFLSGVPAAAAAGILSDFHFQHRRLFMAGAAAVAHAACVLVWFLPVGPVAYAPLLVLRALCGAMVSASGRAYIESINFLLLGF